MRLLEVDLDVEPRPRRRLRRTSSTPAAMLSPVALPGNGLAHGSVRSRVAPGEATRAGRRRGGSRSPALGKHRRNVRHRELPVEAVVGEAEHAVVVGIAAGGQARAARAALRRGAEGAREHDALRRERVEVGAHDAVDPVAMQMAADVVRGHEDHVVRRCALRAPADMRPAQVRPPSGRWLFCLALDRAARDAAHEVALQEDEHGERQRHLQHGRGGEELPTATERRHESGDDDRERTERADAQEGQRDQKVVPDAKEHEDRERGDRWNRHRDRDAQEPHRVAGPVDLRRLEDLAGQPAQVVAEQEDLKGKTVARVCQPDGRDRATEMDRLEDLQHRDQSHLDRHHHQADDDDEEEVPAWEPHPGERVSTHRRDRELDDSGRDRDQDAVEDRGRDAFDLQHLLVAGEREPVWRKEHRPPSRLAHVLKTSERVDDHADCGHDPDRAEDDDHQVQRQPLEPVAEPVERRDALPRRQIRDELLPARRSSLLLLLLKATDVDDQERHDGDEQDHADGGGSTVMGALQLAEHSSCDDVGVVGAVGHHVDDVERLQRVDDHRGADDGDRRPQQRRDDQSGRSGTRWRRRSSPLREPLS